MNEPYDIAVVGGGISGIGAALAAVEMRKRTVLFERDVCCGATSNNSLRIIHGGLRYLQSADMPRVIRSIQDQAYWLTQTPESILPLPSLFALRRTGLKSHLPMSIAGIFYRSVYSMISGRGTKATTVTREEAEVLSPALVGSAQHGAFVWQDALLADPLRFTQVLKERLVAGGAEVREKSPVQAVCRTAEGYEIKPYGIKARSVVSALGPWFGSVRLEGIDLGCATFPAGWCKAFNLVLNRRLCGEAAFAVHAAQGRMFFFVPRGPGLTALGTWYEPWVGAPEKGQPTEMEIERFLESCNAALPSAVLRRQDVSQVEWGILPMRGDSAKGPKLYGSHKMTGSARYVEVMSTKYTTFLSQGRDLVRRVSIG
jgi:glycerol-3-phosphate dehydrogenase